MTSESGLLGVQVLAQLLTTSASLRAASSLCPSDDIGINSVVSAVRQDVENREEQVRRLTLDADGSPRRVLDVLSDVAIEWIDARPSDWKFKVPLSQTAELRRLMPLWLLLCMAVTTWCSQRQHPLPPAIPLHGRTNLLTELLSKGIADGHVHIGACISFVALFFRATQVTETLVERTPPSIQEGDDKYRIDVLILACRVILRLLLEFVKHRSEGETFRDYIDHCELLTESAQSEVAGGSDFWRQVTEAALHSANQDQLYQWKRSMAEFFTKPVRSSETAEGRFPPITDEESTAFKTVSMLFAFFIRNDDPLFTTHLTQVVRVMCLFYRVITPLRSTLEDFRASYGNRRGLKALAELPPDDLVPEVIRSLDAEGHLRRLELRVSIRPPALIRTSRSPSLAQRCMALLLSYRKYLQSTNPSDQIKIVFPLSLIRSEDVRGAGTPPPPIDDSRRLCRWQFSGIWTAVQELCRFLKGCPEATKFFGMIDVAGDEKVLPNWVPCLLLGQLESQVPTRLNYTAHAGECFATPLQGLRRIHEFLQYAPELSRIGHGLALHSGDHMGSERATELLDDLVWAWQFAPVGLQSELAENIRTLAREVYGRSIGPEILLAAYASRFDRDCLIQVGLLTPAGSGPDGSPTYNRNLPLDRLTEGEEDLRLLTQYLVGQVQEQEKRLDRYTDLVQTAYDSAVGRVREAIRGRGVIVETCPTSNMVIGNIRKYSQHPIFDLSSLDVDIPMTLNTDDPGIFHVTLVDEYRAIWQAAAERHPDRSSQSRHTWIESIRELGMVTTASGLAAVNDLRSEVDRSLEAIRRYSSVPS
jgi:hypothetical protein